MFRLDGAHDFCVEEVGVDCCLHLTLPSGIYFGFLGLVTPHSIVLSITSITHDPNKIDCLESL
jgi:hypothetical protein